MKSRQHNVLHPFGYRDVTQRFGASPQSENRPGGKRPRRSAIAPRAHAALITLLLLAGSLCGCQSDSLDRLEKRSDPTPAVDLNEAADIFRPRSARAAADPDAPGSPLSPDQEPGGVPAPEVDVFGTRAARASGNAVRSPSPAPVTSPGIASDAARLAAAKSQGWTVVLSAFRGPDAQESASRLVEQIRQTPELAGAFTEKRGESVIVGLGRFPQPADPQARQTLDMVHSLTGTTPGAATAVRPFASAFLAPPETQTLVGSRPEYNLAQARREFGKDALFTLQVGVYGNVDPAKRATPADVAELRMLAEDAAAKLRKEGELAFYYHSADKSMVTIGVFGNDAVGRNEPATLRQLRARFPHNLYNGAGIRVRQAGRESVQPSVLVKVPTN